MRALIVAAVTSKRPYPVMPYGALCVAESLRAAGHDARVLAAGCSRRSIRRVVGLLNEFRPEVIGLSVRNIDNADMVAPEFYLDDVARLSKALEAAATCSIVAGGSGFSIAPREILEHLGLEYGIAGEGEHAMREFLEFVRGDRAPEDVSGLVRRQQGAVLANPRRPITDLDSCPAPDYGRVDVRAYVREGGFFSVQTKRGCPSACIHCTYPLIEGRVPRTRSPRRVADELEAVCRAAPEPPVFFVDSVFNVPEEHCRAVCEEILRRGLRISWSAYVNPAGVTEDLALLMKNSGCVGVELGVDVTFDPMIRRMGKGFSRDDVAGAFEAFHSSGVPFSVFLLYGGPGHDARGLAEEIRFLDRMPTPNLVAFSFGLRVYPGTALAEQCFREGLLRRTDDLLRPVFYLAPSFDERLLRRFDRLCLKRPAWNTSQDCRSAVLKMLLFLARKGGLRPYWKDAVNYGRTLRKLNPFRRLGRFLRSPVMPDVVPRTNRG